MAREKERKRREEERTRNREANRRLLDNILDRIPATLARDDFEMLVLAAIDRLEYEDWDAMIERYKIDADESSEPDAASFELRKIAEEATEPQLVRMLIEIALIRSGYSDEVLEPADPLVKATTRYANSAKAASTKYAPKGKAKPKPRAATAINKPIQKAARKR